MKMTIDRARQTTRSRVTRRSYKRVTREPRAYALLISTPVCRDQHNDDEDDA